MRSDLPPEKLYGLKKIMTADGRLIKCDGEVLVSLTSAGKTVKVPCVMILTIVPNMDVIVGRNVLRHLNFAIFMRNFLFLLSPIGESHCQTTYQLSKNDFEMRFDGQLLSAG